MSLAASHTIDRLSNIQPAIREVTFEDYDQVAALQSRHGIVPRSREAWVSLWQTNPSWKEISEIPIGWLIHCGAEVVGYLGNLPLGYQFRGRPVHARTIFSWAVDRAYRSHSLRLLHRFLLQDKLDLIVLASANSTSEGIYSRLGFLKAPGGLWNRSAIWIMDHQACVQAALKSRTMGSARWIAGSIATMLAIRDACHEHSGSSKDSFHLCSRFDDRFETFWEEQLRDNGGLLAVRDGATLAWRFASKLELGEICILTACEDNRLNAYAIFIRSDRPDLGLKRFQWVDFQCRPGYDFLIASAIHRMLQHAREEGVHVLENMGCWSESRSNGRVHGPYHRTLQSWSFYYRSPDPEIAEAIANSDAWRPTAFDGDAIF